MNCTDFTNIFKNMSTFNIDFKGIYSSVIPNEKDAYTMFTKNLMFIKFITLIIGIFLIVLNITRYKSIGLIQENMPKFAKESFIFALSGMLPFLLIASLRNKKQCNRNIMFTAIALFITFFGINFLLELSGFYGFVFGTGDIEIPTSKNDNSRQHFVNNVGTVGLISLIVIYAIPLLSMIFSSLLIRNTSPDYKFNFGIGNGLVFLGESVLFGILSAFPIFIIAQDHGDYDKKEVNKEFGIMVAKFTLIHILLQLSGFYARIF
jgi:hypothetical protein